MAQLGERDHRLLGTKEAFSIIPQIRRKSKDKRPAEVNRPTVS